MSDPAFPNPAPASSPDPNPGKPPAADPAGTVLPRNVAAMIACIPLIGGVVFLILEKKDPFVRFYAMQSVFLGSAGVLFSAASKIILLCVGDIPVLGFLVSMTLGAISAIVGLAILALWLVTAFKAYVAQEWAIPFLGPLARKQLEWGNPGAR